MELANAYVERYSWSGRKVSVLLQDATLLRTGKYVVTYRPRGVLSGFLAVVPKLGYVVFISKQQTIRIRMRLSSSLLESGAILSAYCDNTKLVLEDVLVWKERSVWNATFEERWKHMKSFMDEYKPDTVLQGGLEIVFAKYMPLGSLPEKPPRSVLEFVRNDGNTKRLIWVPNKDEKEPSEEIYAKKENGPDVFSLWKGDENLGYGLVRTLHVSKALRNATGDKIVVHTKWNPQFEKYEILGVKNLEME